MGMKQKKNILNKLEFVADGEMRLTSNKKPTHNSIKSEYDNFHLQSKTIGNYQFIETNIVSKINNAGKKLVEFTIHTFISIDFNVFPFKSHK